MTKRDVRVRPERRETLDVRRFAQALIGLAALQMKAIEVEAQAPASAESVQVETAETADDASSTEGGTG